MLKLNEYVSKLTDEQRNNIIESFVVFEKEGFTGDTPIRIATRDYIKQAGIPEENNSVFINQFDNECTKQHIRIRCSDRPQR